MTFVVQSGGRSRIGEGEFIRIQGLTTTGLFLTVVYNILGKITKVVPRISPEIVKSKTVNKFHRLRIGNMVKWFKKSKG